jgi:competence protein ComEC
VFTLVLSSLVGGLSTAPYAAATFNRFTDYGLVANLLTVPVMGSVVMPAGAVAALLAPFGLAGLPLWVMEIGSAWILMIAHWVAGWEGSVTPIPTPGPLVIPLVTLAGAWGVLWRGRLRWAGAVPAIAAVVLWVGAERPLVLISGDGALVGVLGPAGRAVSAPRGAGFAAQNWLENDGDLTSQEAAAARPGFDGPTGARRFTVAGVTGVALKGKSAAAQIRQACAGADFVVINQRIDETPKGCLVLDQSALQRSGALALWAAPGGLRVEATLDQRRFWSAHGRAKEAVHPAFIAPRAAVMAATR